jgi:hypothetical protein
MPLAVFGALITAMQRDEQLAHAFKERFMAPIEARSRLVFERAQTRGEIAEGADLALLGHILPAVAIHYALTRNRPVKAEFIEQIIDQVVLPACRCQAGPD